MHPTPNPKTELQARQAEEARATWGALAEPEPQDTEIEVTAVMPGYANPETVTLASLAEAAEHVLNDALTTIACKELAAIPFEWPAVRAKTIRMLGRGVFYEVTVEREDGWVERIVVRADKAALYTKKTALYFGDVLMVTIEAVAINGTLYYTVDARGASLLSSVAAKEELEDLLKGVE
jgi:hypothetical protein